MLQMFGCYQKWDVYSLAAAMEWFRADVGNERVFSPASPEFPNFHFPIPLLSRVAYLKSVV
jgi:hypothetical protein